MKKPDQSDIAKNEGYLNKFVNSMVNIAHEIISFLCKYGRLYLFYLLQFWSIVKWMIKMAELWRNTIFVTYFEPFSYYEGIITSTDLFIFFSDNFEQFSV